MMTKAKKRPSKALIFPTDQQLKIAREKLPVFEPHDVGSLIREAKKRNKGDVDKEFRQYTEIQCKGLLQSLGVDPSRPDSWRRGFILLAVYHHGVGHLALGRRRTNRNSATWTSDHDVALLREVMILRSEGYSKRGAVKKLAADPEKQQLFPYRRKRHDYQREEQKRAAALLRRLHMLKPSKDGGSNLEVLLGTRPSGLSSIERILHDFQMFSLLPSGVVKSKRPSA
jgi:hypothetical protein